MSDQQQITIAAKCAPEAEILNGISNAGITAVELYTNQNILDNIRRVKEVCSEFPFRYAVHAPIDCFEMELLAELVEHTKAEVVVLHNIYWEDEWHGIIDTFKNIATKLCIENIYSSLEPLKFMRRYGLGFCLDLEHLQMECSGIFEEAFTPVLKKASHIHLTGYSYGSHLWHTHLHHSPEHCCYLLDLLRKAGYCGIVVSEARASLQTLTEFEKLNIFSQKWQKEVYEYKK